MIFRVGEMLTPTLDLHNPSFCAGFPSSLSWFVLRPFRPALCFNKNNSRSPKTIRPTCPKQKTTNTHGREKLNFPKMPNKSQEIWKDRKQTQTFALYEKGVWVKIGVVQGVPRAVRIPCANSLIHVHQIRSHKTSGTKHFNIS